MSIDGVLYSVTMRKRGKHILALGLVLSGHGNFFLGVSNGVYDCEDGRYAMLLCYTL